MRLSLKISPEVPESRVRPCLLPLVRLSARTQGNLLRRRVPDPPLPLCAGSPRGPHHLAHPVHHLSRGVHCPAALRFALSPDAPRGRARCPVSHPWRPQFGVVRGDPSYLAHGALPSGVCARPPEAGTGAHAVWPAPAHLLPC